MTKVFIGSTGKDLGSYRDAAINTCLKLDLHPIAMEHFEAMGLGAVEGSRRKLDAADLYVGIFGFRYGYIEAGYDQSVTEIEFDHAGARGLERLCFVAKADFPFPPSVIDAEHQDKLKTFKERIYKSLIIAEFTTVDSFALQLMHALVKWQDRDTATMRTAGSSLRLMELDGEKQSPLVDTPLRLVTIGRATTNSVHLEDPYISWEHGLIVFRFGTYYYLHLSNVNPTKVWRRGEEFVLRPGEHGEQELRNQDRLVIGDSTLIVELTLAPGDKDYTPTEKAEAG